VPVDVGEHLTRKSVDDDAGSCLAKLVAALEKAKEEAAKPEPAQAEEDEGKKGVVVQAKDDN
jgi:chaperone BCS1